MERPAPEHARFTGKTATAAFQNNRILDLKIVFAELTNIPTTCSVPRCRWGL
jgi:hypothetical protein